LQSLSTKQFFNLHSDGKKNLGRLFVKKFPMRNHYATSLRGTHLICKFKWAAVQKISTATHITDTPSNLIFNAQKMERRVCVAAPLMQYFNYGWRALASKLSANTCGKMKGRRPCMLITSRSPIGECAARTYVHIYAYIIYSEMRKTLAERAALISKYTHASSAACIQRI
jgi:hypothetical protein